MKQTAVEWLEGYLKKFKHIEDTLSLRMAFKQAKEMEKQNKIRDMQNVIYPIIAGLAIVGIFVMGMGNALLGAALMIPLLIISTLKN